MGYTFNYILNISKPSTESHVNQLESDSSPPGTHGWLVKLSAFEQSFVWRGRQTRPRVWIFARAYGLGFTPHKNGPCATSCLVGRLVNTSLVMLDDLICRFYIDWIKKPLLNCISVCDLLLKQKKCSDLEKNCGKWPTLGIYNNVGYKRSWSK